MKKIQGLEEIVLKDNEDILVVFNYDYINIDGEFRKTINSEFHLVIDNKEDGKKITEKFIKSHYDFICEDFIKEFKSDYNVSVKAVKKQSGE